MQLTLVPVLYIFEGDRKTTPEERRGLAKKRALQMLKPEFTKAAQENIQETGANVELDLRDLRSGFTTPERLLATCLAGADEDRAEGWRDYVAALVAAI